MMYYKHSWPESFDTCPCDKDLVKWLKSDEDLKYANVFHMGTGNHHYVGRKATTEVEGVTVIGITASREEMDAYEELVIQEPALLNRYHVLFNDIYMINGELLPTFDVVTLFHLCEFTEETEYRAHNDEGVIEELLHNLVNDGYMVFYTGSMAFDRAKFIINKFIERGALINHAVYESLWILKVG